MATSSIPGITQANYNDAAHTYLVSSPNCLLSVAIYCTVYVAGNTIIMVSFDGVEFYQYSTIANTNPGVAPNAGYLVFPGLSGIRAVRIYPNAGTTAKLVVNEFLYPTSLSSLGG